MKNGNDEAHRQALARAWEDNAERWTRAVREGRIASRRSATDAAIVGAVLKHRPAHLLDVGCGEGWLLRRLRGHSDCKTLGIDGSAALIAAAHEADPEGDYRVLDYESLSSLNAEPGDGFDVIVFNFALFEARLVPVLAEAAELLQPAGVILIQTLHPNACGDGSEGVADGWRCEDFSGFGEAGWRPMPWYQRGLPAWRNTINEADLVLRDVNEPSGSDAAPLSLLMSCNRRGHRS